MNNAQKRSKTEFYACSENVWDEVSQGYRLIGRRWIQGGSWAESQAHQQLVTPVREHLQEVKEGVVGEIAYHSIFFDRTRFAQQIVSCVRKQLANG